MPAGRSSTRSARRWMPEARGEGGGVSRQGERARGERIERLSGTDGGRAEGHRRLRRREEDPIKLEKQRPNALEARGREMQKIGEEICPRQKESAAQHDS